MVPILDLYRSALNISYCYNILARVFGNAELILDRRLKNKPTLTSYRYRPVGVNAFYRFTKHKKEKRYLTNLFMQIMVKRKKGKHMRKADQRARRRNKRK